MEKRGLILSLLFVVLGIISFFFDKEILEFVISLRISWLNYVFLILSSLVWIIFFGQSEGSPFTRFSRIENSGDTAVKSSFHCQTSPG